MTRAFTHGGSAGDVIYHLAPVKDLGGGEFYLLRTAHEHWRMPEERIQSLLTLLRVQPYVTKADACDRPVGDNLDEWRSHWRTGCNLSDMVSSWLGIDHTSRTEPWLFVPEPRPVARVVFHRSPRYHVPAFPWRRAVEKYGREAVFVGDAREHAEFCERFGPVSYRHTGTYLELAQVIAGCELFVGNQSSPAAVAQGLRKNMVQETVGTGHWAWNCHWDRPGMIHGYDEHAELVGLDVLPYRWHSLLGTDRLEALLRLARECAFLPGDVAELGVYRGGSAGVLAAGAPDKTLHLFDTFAGLPRDETLAGVHKVGEFAAGPDEVRALLSGRKVELHPGFFPETAAALPDARYCLVHVDADLYESTLAAIDYFWPRTVPGGALVFDDVDWHHAPGVNRALAERGLLAALERTTPQQGFVRKAG
jgi:hypothetical protein